MERQNWMGCSVGKERKYLWEIGDHLNQERRNCDRAVGLVVVSPSFCASSELANFYFSIYFD